MWETYKNTLHAVFIRTNYENICKNIQMRFGNKELHVKHNSSVNQPYTGAQIAAYIWSNTIIYAWYAAAASALWIERMLFMAYPPISDGHHRQVLPISHVLGGSQWIEPLSRKGEKCRVCVNSNGRWGPVATFMQAC